MTTAFILFLILLALGFFEHARHKARVESVRLRILVNGTRGKTTVTRIITSALQKSGIRTIGRTTGSEAVIVLPDGSTEPVKRRKSASILEMKDFFRRAEKEKCECAVVECMALLPENQKEIASTLVKPQIVVITNTYRDHTAEMGRGKEDVAYALSLSVPEGARLYTIEDYYDSIDADVVHVGENTATMPECGFPLHEDSWRIAKAVLNDQGICDETIISSLSAVEPDIGMKERIEGCFYPYFSVNDVESMEKNLDEIARKEKGREIAVIFNNRRDREYRIGLMKAVLSERKGLVGKVYVIGDYPAKVARVLGRCVPCEVSDAEKLFDMIKHATDTVYVGLGNIKGEGERLIGLFGE